MCAPVEPCDWCAAEAAPAWRRAGCEIVGIEIVDAAKPVQSFPFRGPTAFMLGNEVRAAGGRRAVLPGLPAGTRPAAPEAPGHHPSGQLPHLRAALPVRLPARQGQGLNAKQLAACDSFLYIPQYGPGTASLNVAVAASIVLHSFALWAGYPERAREGQKFVVQERPERTRPRGGGSHPAATAPLPPRRMQVL